ncbi:MAG: cytochrome B, partial [Planctomycetes bacterium]|nr:cytochrome B [Planctomycetota bacterium]
RGGPSVGPDTVQRFFALHVVVLPMVAGVVLVFHLYLVQRYGNALPPSELAKPESVRRTIPFFPDFVVKDVAMWLIALNVLGILVTMFPGHLGPQANPLSPAPEGIHPEWYFMAPFQLLKVLGEVLPGTLGEIVGLLLTTVGGVVMVLIPLYDNSAEDERAGRVAWWLGFVGVASVVVLTAWGYLAL